MSARVSSKGLPDKIFAMRFSVHMSSPADDEAMARVLSIWSQLVCAAVEVSPWRPEHPAEYDILFWDLDGEAPPPTCPAHKLILCSSASQAAISSYALHPVAFLPKPVRLETLQAALGCCTNLWWSSLERLEVLSDRLRFSLPLCDLLWVEGAPRGCTLHSSQECIFARETLSALEQCLPQKLFIRCQRSFLVNLFHVRSLDSEGVHMSDDAVIPLSRSSKRTFGETYRRFCRWKDGAETAEEVEAL